MGWFKRKPKAQPETNDMRVTPVDNPLDFRPDGSIREGDPAWAAIMESMTSGRSYIANQRPDGTWDTKFSDDKD